MIFAALTFPLFQLHPIHRVLRQALPPARRRRPTMLLLPIVPLARVPSAPLSTGVPTTALLGRAVTRVRAHRRRGRVRAVIAAVICWAAIARLLTVAGLAWLTWEVVRAVGLLLLVLGVRIVGASLVAWWTTLLAGVGVVRRVLLALALWWLTLAGAVGGLVRWWGRVLLLLRLAVAAVLLLVR